MAVNKAIVDANVLLALIDKEDKWHHKAETIAKALKEKNWEVVYLDWGLNEVVSVLGKRLEEQNKVHYFTGLIEKLEETVSEEEIEWLYPEVPNLYTDIMKLVKEKEGRLNFHDALIALFAKEYSLGYIVSFDLDFDGIDWITRIKNEEEIE